MVNLDKWSLFKQNDSSNDNFALEAYKEAFMWEDAVRVAKKHLPHKLNEVNLAHQRSIASGGASQSKADLLDAGKMWEKNKQYSQAIDAYLQVSSAQLQVRLLICAC